MKIVSAEGEKARKEEEAAWGNPKRDSPRSPERWETATRQHALAAKRELGAMDVLLLVQRRIRLLGSEEERTRRVEEATKYVEWWYRDVAR